MDKMEENRLKITYEIFFVSAISNMMMAINFAVMSNKFNIVGTYAG